ncbi:uncharacterized protein LOC129241900 [Anastrepha obliqua]|uniref:uncharacterized protein LOC129241900 n=1 Tax=Anastrepha obliqua TaxID=95512 RepID=UPI0024092406|nr:uncharacterized protein LOC129241900 [Anastrepha obliqua]
MPNRSETCSPCHSQIAQLSSPQQQQQLPSHCVKRVFNSNTIKKPYISDSKKPSNPCEAHLIAATAEIEALKQALLGKHNQIVAMEAACMQETERQVELEDSVIAWQDKYDRLYESHKRVQKVNQSLEDKLLKLVDRNTGEKAQLTSDVATLSVRLAQANFNIAKLQREIVS